MASDVLHDSLIDSNQPSVRTQGSEDEAPSSRSAAPTSVRGWWVPGNRRSFSMPPPPVVDAAAFTLRSGLDQTLSRALRHCLDIQDARGAWQVAPDARLFDTGLVAYVLSHVELPRAQEAVRRARAWLDRFEPQTHDMHANLLEVTPLRLLQGSTAPVDLRTPTLYSSVYRRKALLLYVVGLLADVKVLSPYKPSHIKDLVRQFYLRSGSIRMKQWSKVDLISIYALFEAIEGNTAIVEEVCRRLETMQGEDGSFCHNPLSTAIALLALTAGALDSPAWTRCFEHLLDAQQPDGTWRFCTCDNWDTSLMLRALGDHPELAQATPRAIRFLLETQNPDGGWGFRHGVESDNDTSSCVLLAFRGLEGEDVHRAVEKGVFYLLSRQRKDGLWDTWQSSDDHPVEDCVAHITAALSAFRGSHAPAIRAAQRWLEQQYERDGRWTAGWYRNLPYSTLEVSKGLRSGNPVAYTAVSSLRAIQNSDGGFPLEPGEESSPSATGLAVAALAEHFDVHTPFLAKALGYLKDTQQPNGSWPGVVEMYGPRPLLSHFQTTTHAFVGFGLMAAWRRLNKG
jgi:squalene-hopene/tetraprenyl-beta-curcumene cyclase